MRSADEETMPAEMLLIAVLIDADTLTNAVLMLEEAVMIDEERFPEMLVNEALNALFVEMTEALSEPEILCKATLRFPEA